MTMIPEDFTLRRHYLTELRSKQEKCFQTMTNAVTNQTPTVEVVESKSSLDFTKMELLSFGLFSILLFILIA